MLDHRHADDTAFLFFESDFRFYRADCLTPEEWLPLALGAQDRTEGASPPRSLAPAEDSDVEMVEEEEPRERRWSAPPGRFRGAFQSTRPAARGDYSVMPEVRDLIETLTIADRCGHGQLVWFGWNAADPGKKPKRVTAPQYGSHGIIFTKPAALILHTLMQTGRAEHFDVWLLQHLNAADHAGIQASYCVPAMGSYATHVSPNNQGGGSVRPSSWDEKWCQEGTRVGSLSPPHFKQRWLCSFQPKGGPTWLKELDLPGNSTELFWATKQPPAVWWANDFDWQNMLYHRGWINTNGDWEGPVKGQDKGKGKGQDKGKGKGKGKGTSKGPPLEWRRLVQHPDGFNVDPNGNRSPITRLAEHLVTAQAGDTEHSATTIRQKRARAWFVSQYKFRFFVENADEACCTGKVLVPVIRIARAFCRASSQCFFFPACIACKHTYLLLPLCSPAYCCAQGLLLCW